MRNYILTKLVSWFVSFRKAWKDLRDELDEAVAEKESKNKPKD